MNDRFRFRVFDKEKNNYVEDIKFVEQDKYIIEQCANVRDKNGNLIYEGDLLGGLPVVWVNELNGFRVKVNTIRGWDWHYINEFTNQEITGNIHEQAEQEDNK